MSRRSPRLGLAGDDAPEDEMVLAELLAVAIEHGLRACRGVAYRDIDGCVLAGSKGAAACCALGAQLLSPTLACAPLPGLVSGTEGDCNNVWTSGSFEDAGAAFYEALGPEVQS